MLTAFFKRARVIPPLLGVLSCLLLLLVTPCMWYIWFIQSTVPPSPYASCIKYFSKSTGIRIEAHYIGVILAGRLEYFFATQDGGSTWTQFMTYQDDDPYPPDCGKAKELDGQVFWVWMGRQIASTQDGGQHWAVWAMPDLPCCAYGTVQDVQFDDATVGHMTFANFADSGAVSNVMFSTLNSGATWKADP